MINAAVITLLTSTVTGANQANAETRIHFGGWSAHLKDAEYNETHNLVALEHQSVMIGTFDNSYGDESWFAGYRFSREYGYLELSAVPGAVYGYRKCAKQRFDTTSDRQWCPSFLGMATWTQFPLEPSLAIVGEAVAATLAVKF